jgi:diaminopimelate epimerase
MNMPGGFLKIQIDDNWNIHMTGEARTIAEGILSSELLEDMNKAIAD